MMLNLFTFELYMLRRCVAAFDLANPPNPVPEVSKPDKTQKMITLDDGLDTEKMQIIIDTLRGDKLTQPEIVQRVTFSKSTVRIYVSAMVRLGLLRECGRIGKSKLYRAEVENVPH